MHTSNKKTPENVRRSEESIDANTNLEMCALTYRIDPPLAIGDNVKI